MCWKSFHGPNLSLPLLRGLISVGELECKILNPLPSPGGTPLFSQGSSWGCHTIEHNDFPVDTVVWSRGRHHPILKQAEFSI